jgi:DNA-binding XRE family transcriptional regulator
MMTPNQIRAARALLDWSQNDLGQRTGLSQAAIANIETAKHRPNESTHAAIMKAFSMAGIDFIDGGVRLRPEGMEIIEGPDITARMPTIYFEEMLRTGAEEVLINGVDFSILDESTRESVDANIKRLIAEEKRQRVLVCEGTTEKDIIGPADWYRAIPAQLFSALTPSFIYHTCFAVMLVEKQQVIILRNGNLAEYQTRQFEHLWAIGSEL